ncbi:MAG: class I SAM-dependent methyltransferase [Mucilaginibacter sp.]
MLETIKKFIRTGNSPARIKERDAADAYNIWAAHYDAQPGNLMLDLDELVFAGMLGAVDLKNKQVADIGCGTGRHWPKILKGGVAGLSGYDVSAEMLKKLADKFPGAKTCIITDNQFAAVPDHTYDLIISTLTVAHIENIADALQAWARILKPSGDVIITDFHPDTLSVGGQRTFRHKNSQIAVRNFVHPVNTVREILLENNFRVIKEVDKKIDEQVQHYYKAKNALHVYNKFKDFPIIYGIHFRRG